MVENKRASHRMSHRMSHVSRNREIIHFRLRTPVIEDEWVVNGYRNKQLVLFPAFYVERISVTQCVGLIIYNKIVIVSLCSSFFF